MIDTLVEWGREGLRQLAYGYYRQITKFRKPYKYLLILSHMRSGSSLLTHILASNPDIAGYGETHLKYNSQDKVSLLPYQVLLGQRQLWYGMEEYALDKVLHNDHLYASDVELLLAHDTKFILLLRGPEGAVSSIIRTLNYSEEEAVDYYSSRLVDLKLLVEKIAEARTFVFITYSQLLEETDAAFRLLEDYLALSVPLSEEYGLLRTTGRLGIGDPSDTIKKGRIIRKRDKEPVALSPDSWDRVRAAHKDLHESAVALGRHLADERGDRPAKIRGSE